LAELGERLERTKKRKELSELLAGFLRGLSTEEIPPAVRLTIGQVFPEWDGRALNVSWKAVMSVVEELIEPGVASREQVWSEAVDGGQAVQLLLQAHRRDPPTPPPLTLLEVYRAFEAIAATSGRGSRARKSDLIRGLLERASDLEAKYLAKVVFQDMRHGVSEGIMLTGIARAAGTRLKSVRRANQLWGDVGEVALVALTDGERALQAATVRLFRPIKPMLAQTSEEVTEAYERFGERFALEYKLDGARVQIHCQDDQVRIYTRSLADVTPSLPDISASVLAELAASEAILDGEVIAVDEEGRPLPFQHLMRRFRRKRNVEEMVGEVPARLYLFDLLYADGRPYVDTTNVARWSALQDASGGLASVCRLVPESPEEAKRFVAAARRDGHEGVMAKDLHSAYSPGSRGKAWLKLKHVMSLDLVIVAADWGYGRRHGWLSNYHLAALDADSGEFSVVGKTFKGLRDAEFKEMTQMLLQLERVRRGGTVFVEPKVVVEVRFNEIQESTQYTSGMALRFARVTAIRDDKRPGDADTLATLRALYDGQFEYKGRMGAPASRTAEAEGS
jgi:DNA ligase-1